MQSTLSRFNNQFYIPTKGDFNTLPHQVEVVSFDIGYYFGSNNITVSIMQKITNGNYHPAIDYRVQEDNRICL